MPVDASSGPRPGAIRRALRNALVDRVTGEVVRALVRGGLDPIVLKGPALASWLYTAEEARGYGDSDVLVAPDRRDAAEAVLRDLGFAPAGAPAHPRIASPASQPWHRENAWVDLHVTLDGLAADPARVWERLSTTTQPLVLDGTEVRILAPPARALHVALHAAQHQESKPITDLERAVALLPDERWQEAATLARELDGLVAFAAGLRVTAAGAALLRRLDVGGTETVGTVLRGRHVPLAEGMQELLVTRGIRARARLLVAELFPSPAFMRWWTPLARRGRLGLALAYPWRLAWLIAHAPRGAAAVAGAWARARRSH